MNLDKVQQQTTWNDASGSINTNFEKIRQAILALQSGGGAGGGSANVEGSAFISVSQDGVISLDVDQQGGLGRTEQGLGIVDIPDAAAQGLKDYADTAAQTAYEQAYDDAVRAASSYAEKMPFKTINGQSVRGEGDLTIVGTKGEQGEKGDKGDAGVTSAEVSVDNKAGLPSATASVENQVLKINFSGLKGEQGNSGYTGAADELEVVNNLTQGGAAAALSAEMGKQLGDELYGKVVAAQRIVDLSQLEQQNCSLGGSNNWYMNGSAGRHKAVSLQNAVSVKVVVGSVNTYIAFVTSAYAPPYANNASVPYCSGHWGRKALAANQTYEEDVPSDAAWLILTTVDGGGTTINYSEVVLTANSSETQQGLIEKVEDLQDKIESNKVVEIINNLTEGGTDKALSAEMGKQLGSAIYGDIEHISLASLVEQNCSLGGNVWYMQGSAGRHKAIPVANAKSVSVEVGALPTFVAFVTSAYAPPYYNGNAIPFCNGYTQRTAVAAATTFEAEVPSDAAWLILTTIDGSGNVIEYGDIKVARGDDKGILGATEEQGKVIEKLNDDIYGVPSDYLYTQDDFSASDYLTAQGRRGYIQWPISEYPSWEILVSNPATSTIRCSIQGSAAAAYGNQTDDTGWIYPGKSAGYNYLGASKAVNFARIVFTDNATANAIPSVEDIMASGITFSFKAVAQAGGLIVRMDALESKVAMPAGGIAYQGEKVDLSEHGFTYKVIGSLSAGVSSRQGSALFGKYFFQFHNTLENIVVYDLDAKKNVQVISMTAIPNCHAGSGGFGNEYYDAADAFPLLYVSSMDEMKVYVFRITGAVGAWNITLVQTITIASDVLKIPNITIDRESNKIVFFGYTKWNWNDATGNQSVITSCDIPLLSEGDVTISEFYNVSRLPFIYAQQGAFARFGKLYLSYGNTVSDIGAFVIDYKGGSVLTSIDFGSMGNFEPEGFEKYKDKVIMTDQNGNIYELSF